MGNHHIDWTTLASMATVISVVVPFIVKYLVVPSVKSKMDDVEESLGVKFQKIVSDAVTPLSERLKRQEDRLDRHLEQGHAHNE